LRGSGRSIDGVHLRDTLDLVTKGAPDMVRRFGGHAMAAGLTLAAARYEGFVEAFEQATRSSCDRSLFERTVATDGPLTPAEITLGLVEACDRHIWGQGFPAPLFANEFDVVEQRLVKERHLKLALELDGRRYTGMFFRHAEPLPRRARLAYRPAVDDFQGQRRLTLMIEHCESSG
jgi:single-stranded-DNA-specific exonuclease